MSDATIQDVAQAAGVSAATVSRALNNGSVKQATRDRVRKAADRLGYKPNAAARDLIAGKSGKGNIAVFVTDVGNFYFTDLFKGLFAQAQSLGYRLFVADLELTNDVERTVGDVVSSCEGQVVVSPRISDTLIRRLFPQRNTVLANRQIEGYTDVCIDDRSGIMQAVRHLASLGHKRIAYISGLSHSWSNRARIDAVSRGCEEFGVECVAIGPFEPTYGGGVNAGDALMLEEGVTAVIAFNDLVASGVVSRLVERGLSIPEDISVMGIDDSVLSRASRPQMTTIDVRQERMGSQAVRLLAELLDAEREGVEFEPVSHMIPEILITRDSTAAARIS
ncbi:MULTISPECIES: LacI family DNA-binding transcriptional regulator [Bifidobacterium]|uniref:Transcriptional regulator, LacI family n=2 Tax=Bifidobacterium TaxID=1678 RepID=A0A261FW40_9BIFI|nr:MULTISPECIES: LacI family DNA-binding transcriptional regulator [Bifidobacterium]OZG63414.1 transcriptional regulator, LacI family [Bifidobacterium lemurum]OZG67480.1 transcriptional regulator, LacI family [Bifidobacterium eulemuris]QOL33037.1 LacI family DNA-binding transcriptional regulator [Bifidobacterium eulemuris]QOL34319.1 LacI family DNA-binding transcriptional regulator [Bifidobacterium lemurum]